MQHFGLQRPNYEFYQITTEKTEKNGKNGNRKFFHQMTFLKRTIARPKFSVFPKFFRYFRCSSLAIAELKVLHFSLMNNHHRGTEAVLLEGSVLVGAGLVVVLQFGDDGIAEDAVTFAVDEDDATPFLLEVLVHGFAEHS